MSQEILEDHLRKIFNLCDDDLDGVISIKDLSKREEIQEFGEQMSELLAKLDPFGTGQVSFNAFVEGIQSFLSVNDLPAKVDQTLEENGLDRGDQAVLNELNLSEDLPSKASHTQIHIGDLESSSECSEDNEERAHVVDANKRNETKRNKKRNQKRNNGDKKT